MPRPWVAAPSVDESIQNNSSTGMLPGPSFDVLQVLPPSVLAKMPTSVPTYIQPACEGCSAMDRMGAWGRLLWIAVQVGDAVQPLLVT
jgi:hypothetical protein